MKNNKITVGLILGGASPERTVSKHSAQGVLKALRNLDYHVVLLDPAYGINQPKNEIDYFADCDCFDVSASNYIEAIDSYLNNKVDIAFIALHGSWGEDGKIQAILEFMNIPYTGSGILASAASMDKHITKSIIKQHGVSTANWIVVEKGVDRIETVINSAINELKFPIVVKPNDQGSGIGLSICKTSEQLETGIALAFQFSKRILLEKFIAGRELTVGILGNKVLPVVEIKPKHEYYDYECKYTPGMSEYEVPAKIPNEVTELIQNQAMLAYNSVGCENYGRIDFRMDDKFNVYCLEINTLPGLTSTSLLPKAAKASGISFEQLINEIIGTSLRK
jgi:D-alanine-D-alanine ligase